MAKVLIVDDSELMCTLITEILHEAQFETKAVHSATAAQTAIREFEPDLVLLDVVLPDMDGFEVCKLLKMDSALREVPVIFITSVNDEKSVIDGFLAGGSDYVSKPFRPTELLARVRSHVYNKRMADLVRKSHRELEHLNGELLKANVQLSKMLDEKRTWAMTDALTGLYNRHYLSENAAAWNSDAERGILYHLIIADIDDFKLINDNFGHHVGDEILCQISLLLREICKKNPLIRWGGEEFLIVASGLGRTSAEDFAEDMRSIIAGHVFRVGGVNHHCTITLGIAELNPRLKMDDNISKADFALYKGKSCGKNQVVLD